MAIPRFLRPIIQWASHWISRGASALGLLSQATSRYPGINQTLIEDAVRLGQQSVEVAARANRLGLQEQLSVALAGQAQPEDQVEIRVLVSVRDAAGGRDDFSLRETFGWNETFGTVLDFVEAAIRARLARSPGLEVIAVDIVPPMLLGR